MKLGSYMEAIGVGITIVTDIEVDSAELAAGHSVDLPEVRVGTEGGKPLYLHATLTTQSKADQVAAAAPPTADPTEPAGNSDPLTPEEVAAKKADLEAQLDALRSVDSPAP